jgi:hypothetical protein
MAESKSALTDEGLRYAALHPEQFDYIPGHEGETLYALPTPRLRRLARALRSAIPNLATKHSRMEWHVIYTRQKVDYMVHDLSQLQRRIADLTFEGKVDEMFTLRPLERKINEMQQILTRLDDSIRTILRRLPETPVE